MVLDGQDRILLVGDALDGAVVEVDVGHLHRGRQPFGIQGIAVILGRDIDTIRGQVPHRVVCAPVPEFQLEGLASEGLAQYLVAQAYPHDRLHPRQCLDRLDDPTQEGRVPGARGQD